jgi:hypothetical protein
MNDFPLPFFGRLGGGTGWVGAARRTNSSHWPEKSAAACIAVALSNYACPNVLCQWTASVGEATALRQAALLRRASSGPSACFEVRCAI